MQSTYTAGMEWNVTPKEAIELQKQLRDDVRLEPLAAEPATIAACDVSMNRFAKNGFAGFVTMTYPNMFILGESIIEDTIPFPYIPGLLSFREIPMLLKAWGRLSPRPELIVVDGIGIAHPRRLGIASHLGLMLDIPTIGCAKSVLIGTYAEPANEIGATSDLIDPQTNEVIGAALCTKLNVQPVFISPGHRITLDDSLRIMKKCIGRYRVPEPTRQAHEAVNRYRRDSITTPV